MCGRFSFVASKEKVRNQFGVEHEGAMLSSYNLAPSSKAYLITNEQPHQLDHFIWGLIPYWTEYSKTHSKLFNARCEGIISRASFRMPIRKRRCIVLADSFYEWKKEADGPQPYRICLKDNSLLAIAGIWDSWKKIDSEEIINTFSIITCPSNNEMEKLHSRMPVILNDEERQKEWLSDINLGDVQSLMQTAPDNLLNIYPVSQKLNNPKFNSSELHESIQLPPTLFD